MILKRINKRNLISNIVAIILLLLVCIVVNRSGNMQWPQYISKILIFSIAALALNVVCGCLGEFALGHGGFLLIGYTVAFLIGQAIFNAVGSQTFRELFYTSREGLKVLGFFLIIGDSLIAAIITACFGFLVGIIALGRLKGDYLAIVTLGFGLIFVNIANNIDFLGGATGKGISTKLAGTPLLYAIMLVVTIFLVLTFMKSRFGRNILACRDDNIASEACGVPVKKYKVLAFTFSAFIAGLAGGLYAHYNTFSPGTFGQDLSIELLIIVVLGGLGSLTGSVIASIIIVLYNLWICSMSWVPPFFKNNPKIIYGVVLVAIMLFRSSGILGTSEFSWDWFYTKIKLLWQKILRITKKIFKKNDKVIDAPKEDK